MGKTTRWSFYVGGKPYVLHQHGEEDGAAALYGSVDPIVFVYWTLTEARTASEPPTLDGEMHSVGAEQAKHLAALRFRMFYLNLLETFFAHFFANVQAPQHPAGWLTTYSSQTLTKLAERLKSDPWRADDTTRVLSRPAELVGWLFGIERVEPDREALADEVGRVVSLMRALAREYADSGTRMEYNSIKHGGRAQSASWSLSLSEAGASDSSVAWQSANGSHFGVANGIGTNQIAWRRRSQGWTLERDIGVAVVLAKLLHNLVQVRRNPDVAASQPYFRFKGLDVKELLRPRQGIGHFEVGHPDLAPEKHLTEAEARAMADAEQLTFERWLFRLKDAEGGDAEEA